MAKRKPTAKKPDTPAKRQFRISPGRFRLWSESKREAYDAAATNRYNEKHWAQATSADADSALVHSGELAILRQRCRHEIRNNPYAVGIGRKLANYVIGVGPSLQVQTPDDALNDSIELLWRQWCNACDRAGMLSYAEMLHLGIRELFPAGEYFRVFTASDTDDESLPPLRLTCLEAERVTSPYSKMADAAFRDGIEVDGYGKRLRYWVCKKNPWSAYWNTTLADTDFDQYAPSDVVHLAMADRPEQVRGCPLLAQSLEIFAKTRRWDEATIAAAERAALFGIIMCTNSDMLLGDNPASVDPEEWELSAGMGVIAPPGYKAEQVKPEHPGAQYDVFRKAKLQDCGASVDMPYNVLAADSSGHNYASGRLDWQGMVRSIGVLRSWVERRDLTPTFDRFWALARLANFPRAPESIPVAWRWPGFEHVDPLKEASAAEVLLRNGLLSYADYYAEKGKDWRQQLRQITEERKAFQAMPPLPGSVPEASGTSAGAPHEE